MNKEINWRKCVRIVKTVRKKEISEVEILCDT